MSAGPERSEAVAETSPGRALALLALAPIAERLADEQECRLQEEDRQHRLREELAKLPELPLPPRPNGSASAEYSLDISFSLAFWGEVASLVFIGPFLLGPLVYDKKFTEAGYPWLLVVIAPLVVAFLAGFLPQIAALPRRARFQAALAVYEDQAREAEHRKAQRAAIEAKFKAPQGAPVDDGSPADVGEAPGIRVDGCYLSDADGPDYHYFLRFFPGGDVMTVTVSGTGGAVDRKTVRSVMGWLDPSSGDDGLSRGRLSRTGSEISFSAISADGTVNYEGTVLPGGEELRLQSHSLINGHRDEQVWRFVAA